MRLSDRATRSLLKRPDYKHSRYKNGSGHRMPKGLGTFEVLTSFPLGPCGDPYPTNKQTNKQQTIWLNQVTVHMAKHFFLIFESNKTLAKCWIFKTHRSHGVPRGQGKGYLHGHPMVPTLPYSCT